MKSIIFTLAISVTACSSSKLHLPAGKSESDYYADLNACIAETERVIPPNRYGGEYQSNCMKAKGYGLNRAR